MALLGLILSAQLGATAILYFRQGVQGFWGGAGLVCACLNLLLIAVLMWKGLLP